MNRNWARRTLAIPLLWASTACGPSGGASTDACVPPSPLADAGEAGDGRQEPPEAVPPPNIVLILADDMGYGDVGAFNPDSGIPTPSLDALADQGMRFTDAHAPAAVCQPTRSGMLTGRYPFRAPSWGQIEGGRETLATLLGRAGYRTIMVGKWHLGFYTAGGLDWDETLQGGPLAHGFDSFFGIPSSLDIPPYLYIRDDQAVETPSEEIDAGPWTEWGQGPFWREGRVAPGFAHEDVLPDFRDEAVHYIDDWAEDPPEARPPLFLYLALAAPHTPWLPQAEFQGRSEAGSYGDFVVAVDQTVGRVLEALEDAEAQDDTLVIFTSDNGPFWLERDRDRFGHDAAGGLRGMKGDAWEAGHRMPFVVRWPGRVPANTINPGLLSLTDLMATFATLAGGVELPHDAGEDSLDMTGALLDPEQTSLRENLITVSGPSEDPVMAVRSGRWKLIPHPSDGEGFSHRQEPTFEPPGPESPAGQLYDLGSDLGECHNAYDEHPERVQELKALLEELVDAGRTR